MIFSLRISLMEGVDRHCSRRSIAFLRGSRFENIFCFQRWRFFRSPLKYSLEKWKEIQISNSTIFTFPKRNEIILEYLGYMLDSEIRKCAAVDWRTLRLADRLFCSSSIRVTFLARRRRCRAAALRCRLRLETNALHFRSQLRPHSKYSTEVRLFSSLQMKNVIDYHNVLIC